MSDILQDVDEAIAEAGREGYPHEKWCIYVPTERLDEIHQVQIDRSPMEVYDKGQKIRDREIIPDPLVDEIIVLPENTSDIPGFEIFKNPPEHLIEQIVDIQSNTFTDHMRGLERKTFNTRVFFDLENEHRRLNHSKINKYNFWGVSGEYDEEPNVLERLKFGYQISLSKDMHSLPDGFHRNHELFETIRDNINSIIKRPIYKSRNRTIKGPYPVLDIDHQEKIRIGTEYKYYGGLLLKYIETPASKIEMPEETPPIPQ